MHAAEVSLLAFAVFHLLRVLAYLPQIISIHRDAEGANAVSSTSWVLFSASHFASVAYSLTIVVDGVMATVFAINGALCALIVAQVHVKRAQLRRMAMAPDANETPQIEDTETIRHDAALNDACRWRSFEFGGPKWQAPSSGMTSSPPMLRQL